VKDHCKHGHDLTAADAVYVNHRGGRQCRLCRQQSSKRYQRLVTRAGHKERAKSLALALARIEQINAVLLFMADRTDTMSQAAMRDWRAQRDLLVQEKDALERQLTGRKPKPRS